MEVTALSNAKVGTAGVVEYIDLPEEVSHHLAHLGFLPGTRVEILRRAPAGRQEPSPSQAGNGGIAGCEFLVGHLHPSRSFHDGLPAIGNPGA